MAFVKGDPRIHKGGRPRKKTLQDILSESGASFVDKDGNVIEDVTRDESLLRAIVDAAVKNKNPEMMKFVYQHLNAPQADGELLKIKKQVEKARAKKIQIENDIKQQRGSLRMETETAMAKIKILKAEQEEMKTKAMLGEYIDVALMRYYFSFFQRGIADCFAAVKKVSPDIKRLYQAGRDKDAEKEIITEMGICFSNAVKALEEEIKNDGGEAHAE
jgi:hypothetical protein